MGLEAELTLYVSGATPGSLRATRNLERYCRERPEYAGRLRVVDLMADEGGDAPEILVTPTLLIEKSGYRRLLVGDFSCLAALDAALSPVASPSADRTA